MAFMIGVSGMAAASGPATLAIAGAALIMSSGFMVLFWTLCHSWSTGDQKFFAGIQNAFGSHSGPFRAIPELLVYIGPVQSPSDIPRTEARIHCGWRQSRRLNSRNAG